MTEEEYDYMSDDFLNKCTEQTGSSKPGLIKTYDGKREHEKWKKRELVLEEQRLNKRIKKSIKEKEQENREEGMQKVLDSSNKGFAMLAKMGYTPGTSLGKDGTGRKDPVPIQIKEGRGGLGREEAVKQLLRKKQMIMEKRAKDLVSEFDPAAFRAKMREKHMLKRSEADLSKAQKSCRQLDLGKEFTEPMESWFWPKERRQRLLDEDAENEEDEEEEEEEVMFSIEEQLEMVVEYLRTEHTYCTFCGISFYNEEDMNHSCPGPGRDDHDNI